MFVCVCVCVCRDHRCMFVCLYVCVCVCVCRDHREQRSLLTSLKVSGPSDMTDVCVRVCVCVCVCVCVRERERENPERSFAAQWDSMGSQPAGCSYSAFHTRAAELYSLCHTQRPDKH